MNLFSSNNSRLQQPQLKDLTDKDFEKFRQLIYDQSGISLNQSKKELLRTRLRSRLIKEGFSSYSDYFEYVEADTSGQALVPLLDDISTNLTSFFREINHFNFLNSVLPKWIKDKESSRRQEFRIWSAGCSTGEEPYSILFTVLDQLGSRAGSWNLKFLATDLNTEVLNKASLGYYGMERVENIPRKMLQNYFYSSRDESGKETVQVKDEYRRAITFRRFNLMTPQFPFRHKFDFIFCRNVMIYFDRPTQEKLVNKYHGVLKPGGYLFIGHSESLTGLNHQFKYIQPTIYQT